MKIMQSLCSPLTVLNIINTITKAERKQYVRLIHGDRDTKIEKQKYIK